MDALQTFKDTQKQMWSSFTPMEVNTTVPAARLVKHAGLKAGQQVLDVACGTGVVAVTAARLGCQVTGLDLTPDLLARARENAQLAGVSVDWREGDVEELPFPDATFDAVVSQFGHMFGPRPEVTLGEMLRVLKPGGRLAFSTWAVELFTGRTFILVGRYSPPPPDGVSPPVQWGDPAIVRERLGSAVKDIVFDRDSLRVPVLSPKHFITNAEKLSPPITKIVERLSKEDPGQLAAFRKEYEALAAEYFEGNTVHQDYLMTRATKV